MGWPNAHVWQPFRHDLALPADIRSQWDENVRGSSLKWKTMTWRLTLAADAETGLRGRAVPLAWDGPTS